MRHAILSDAHGRLPQLEAVLADARARRADQMVSLGDVGGDACVAALRQAGGKAVFGNSEVSGWRHLAVEHRSWVRSWPPLLDEDGFLAVHAAPWWTPGLQTVEDFGHSLRTTGRSWRSLFPYLGEGEDHLWRALAELEAAGRGILFHGHTHKQTIRCALEGRAMEPITERIVHIDSARRYIVGVGSVGLPEDGGWAAYALYDAEAGQIELIRLREPRR